MESAVGTHLINAAQVSGFKLYYWRQGNEEVDFVMAYKRKTVALEVKTEGEMSTSGIKTFQQQFHPGKVLLVGKRGIS